MLKKTFDYKPGKKKKKNTPNTKYFHPSHRTNSWNFDWYKKVLRKAQTVKMCDSAAYITLTSLLHMKLTNPNNIFKKKKCKFGY